MSSWGRRSVCALLLAVGVWLGSSGCLVLVCHKETVHEPVQSAQRCEKVEMAEPVGTTEEAAEAAETAGVAAE